MASPAARRAREKHVVATLAEMPPGSRKLVTIGRREIAVFNIHGDFFAVLDRCPHQGGSLCKGSIALCLCVPGRVPKACDERFPVSRLRLLPQGRGPLRPAAQGGPATIPAPGGGGHPDDDRGATPSQLHTLSCFAVVWEKFHWVSR